MAQRNDRTEKEPPPAYRAGRPIGSPRYGREPRLDNQGGGGDLFGTSAGYGSWGNNDRDDAGLGLSEPPVDDTDDDGAPKDAARDPQARAQSGALAGAPTGRAPDKRAIKPPPPPKPARKADR